MSEQQNFGFGKFVPGFDFLQNLSKGASQSQATLPTLSSWVAPTLNVEELDKRISELKAVHFWLDQNSKALSATIQALELQKMTLATLKGMNFNMAEIAEGLKLKPAGVSAGESSVAERFWMNGAEVLDVGRDAIWLTLQLCAPVLLVALVVGVGIGLLQALTQIQEQTLVFAPKIVAIFVSLLIFLPLMGALMSGFMRNIAARIAGM